MAQEPDSDEKRGMSLGIKVALGGVLALLCVGGVAGGLVMSLGVDGALAAFGLGAGQTEQASLDGAGHDEAAPDSVEGGDHGGGHGAAPATDPNEMAVTPFKEIIVNINSTTATGRTTSRFMKLNIALVYDERAEGAERVEERRLFLRDSFQDYLRQLSERDLQGSLGLITVKQELLRRARTITESDAPQEMLVSDLIVQ